MTAAIFPFVSIGAAAGIIKAIAGVADAPSLVLAVAAVFVVIIAGCPAEAVTFHLVAGNACARCVFAAAGGAGANHAFTRARFIVRGAADAIDIVSVEWAFNRHFRTALLFIAQT